MKAWLATGAIVWAGATIGCSRPVEQVYSPSQQVQNLKPELQEPIASILREHCGTPQAPKLLGSPEVSPAYLKQGAAVYARYCVQCHGVTGDGQSVSAAYLIPKPRDYRPGIFKFTSTTYGAKPLREDLIRTVRRGIRGTSMPSFNRFAPRDLEAVVDYVLVLTHRGELEADLAEEVEVTDSIEASRVPEMVASVLNRWTQARGQVVYPMTPMPPFTTAILAQGRTAFLTLACAQCHGADGRGQLATNVGVDAWRNPTKAADLTSGMLRGGTEPLDLYRHIDAGINGTPMPSFHSSLQTEPQRIWHLVGYVLQVADSRRRGQIPESGLIENGILKPLPGVNPTTAWSVVRGPWSVVALPGRIAGRRGKG